LDGNREGSALWNYGWNGRNQLVRARTKTWHSAPQGWDVRFDYDAEGRRFKKEVTRYADGNPIEQKVIYFVWDGWDLLYECHQDIQGNLLLDRKYVWGPDIADGHAGGAGGLLLIRERRGTTTKDYYPLFDGTGHVTGLTDSAGNLVAEYWWGPFGELIEAKGEMADANPFRYATKYYDTETGLYYFGQRYYDPVSGQWLSREPLGESESLNLYAYCGNDPVNHVDVLGLAKVATDGRGNLTELGQVILDVAKGDPNAARSLLMAAQVNAETAGIKVTGDGGKDSIRNVMEAIETAVGQAQSDGRREWRFIAAEAGLTGESTFGGYKDAWMTTKLAEYAPLIAANAGTALELRAAERAANEKVTAYQNSAPYKIREFLDAPMDVGAALFSGFMGTDVTTGTALTWNSLNNGGGFSLLEVGPGERAFAASMVFLPIGRGTSFVDDFVRTGARGRSFAANRTIATSGGSGVFALQPESILSKHIRGIHAALPHSGATAVFRKGDISMAQLRTLTNVTGDEYSMFTLGSQRFVVRGRGSIVDVSPSVHADLLSGKYGRFSGHTHPPGHSLNPGPGDQPFLRSMNQKQSGIWGNDGAVPFDRGFPWNIND
jgi:RHS repeat-associated protein